MMKLVYKDTGKEVQKGDVLTDFRGELKEVAYYWRVPTHGSGKITVCPVDKELGDPRYCREYYVSVFGLEWRED